MRALVDYFMTAASTGEIITLRGENYIISNAVVAQDSNNLKARFLLASVENPNKIFDFEVSAKLYDSLK